MQVHWIICQRIYYHHNTNSSSLNSGILADFSISNIEMMCGHGLSIYPEGHNEEVEKLLKEVQYDIMKLAVATELMEEEYYD